jgi:hypothetical protein
MRLSGRLGLMMFVPPEVHVFRVFIIIFFILWIGSALFTAIAHTRSGRSLKAEKRLGNHLRRIWFYPLLQPVNWNLDKQLINITTIIQIYMPFYLRDKV